MSDIKIMIVHETVADSYKSDAGTFGGLILSVLIGWWLDSQALQWIAALMLIVSVIFRSLKGYGNHYTVAQARTKLDEIEAKIKATK